MPSAADVGAVANALVDVRGDLVAASGDNTPVRLAAGSNGQMLMADSAATAGLRYVDPPANRNIAINGAMQVAQRGTSTASITIGGYYTADRWNFNLTTLGTWTQSLEADAPTGSGFRNSLKLLCTTAKASPAAGDLAVFQQILEGQDLQRIKKGTASAEQLTLSFWVKSNVTGTHVVNIQDGPNARYVGATYSVNASGTWERKTITFPADSSGTVANDNAGAMTLRWWLAAGSSRSSGTLDTTWVSQTLANIAAGQTNLAAATNNYWQITGVQLETGPVATPFEFEPYEATLRKCQRYYWRLAGGGAYSAYSQGYNVSTTGAYYHVGFPGSMRIAPTSVDYGNLAVQDSGGTVIAATSVSLDQGSDVSYSLAVGVASGLTQHRPGRLINNNNAAGFLAFSAEL
jgi:hypothetical protein